MIAVDTNIIVRALTRDDAEQAQSSAALLADNDVFIPITVVLETEWVLRHAYGYDRPLISAAFRALFGVSNIFVGEAVAVDNALRWYEEGLDFADALHLSLSQQCEALYSFDIRFNGKSPSASAIPVREPA